jgi:anti-sigma-K factor RskA
MQAIDATPNQTPAPIPIVNMPTNGVAVQHAASEPQLKLNRWLAAACAIMAATLLASILMMGKQNAALSQQLAQLQTQTQSAELATKSLYGEVRSLKNSFYQVSASNYQIVKMVGLPISKQSNSTIFWDKDTKEVKIYASNLPTPAANEQYQLWAIVGGAPVSLGVFDPNDSALQNMQNISNPQAFAVTLEKRGGSTTPTMDKMYVIGNV